MIRESNDYRLSMCDAAYSFALVAFFPPTASLANKKLGTGRIKVWGCDILVDWADPVEEPDEETMARVKVAYVRNLKESVTEEALRTLFEAHGKVEKVKKMKDYAFVHFEERENALK